MAQQLSMDTSCYNRREKGLTRISTNEWLKLSKILEQNVDDIKDFDPPVLITEINDEQIEITSFKIPKEFIDNRTRYIKLLEDKVLDLENQVFELKQKV